MTTTAEWKRQLAAHLTPGEKVGAERFAEAVPASYRDRVPPVQAARDLAQINRLVAAYDRSDRPPPQEAASGSEAFGAAHRLVVRADPDGGPDTFRLRRYGIGPVELSSLLPVLESFGLVVVEAVPARIEGLVDAEAVYIDDVGVRVGGGVGLDVTADGARLVESLEAVALGDTDVDSLNRLVIAAGLSWVQVRVLRTYRRYRRQTGSTLSDAQLDDPLVAYPRVAAGLVAYFEARLDPVPTSPSPGLATAARQRVLDGLEDVDHREQDRVLRDYLALVDATTRTSFFLRTPSGRPCPTLTVKLASREVPDLPAPRPEIEAFVHGPVVEGIHLRFGPVARGGIRWSDRPDDFRTEVLDLAEAQVKKNAIIVPTGAKGGFVCRRSAEPTPADVRAAYELFIGALLDITDNLVDGRVVPPTGVVPLDGEDPYLVVAADRGTSAFSDVANGLAADRHFWLGDAFASGGSRGYDHKAMGITARGAWVAVRRHFHQLGVDVQTEPVRVAGIGDMSGDVFGNGMLQSRTIELVAAFDHRHVFVDPAPDPARSFEERRRLAALGPSSWDDYDRDAISEGGGVWSRDAKTVPLAPAARAALGVGVSELSPPALISAILTAPVDLLWFGGIGTYVKAPDEADAEVGDHANDEVRVVADDVRARVIAEGGNLGVTNRARIRYSRRGGRINADFIDNAAGVATSDREVNLKILLALATERGRLAPEARDAVLRAVEDDVAVDVLRQVDHSVSVLNRAVPESARQIDAYEALQLGLEARGRIDRTVEALPDADEWQRRRVAGAGLIRPELAVLLAGAKSDLLDAVVASDLHTDPCFREAVRPYFPPLVLERFGDLVPEHRLYPQLLATDLSGEIVDRMGVAWAHETAAELDVSLPDVAAAFWTARQLLHADQLWEVAESVGVRLSADADDALNRTVAEAVGALARRYLLAGSAPAGPQIHADRTAAEELESAAVGVEADGAPDASGSPTSVPGVAIGFPVDDGSTARVLGALGVPAAPARRVGLCARGALVADIADVARWCGRTPTEVLRTWTAVASVGGVAALVKGVRAVPITSRWDAWQAGAIVDDVTGWCAGATLSVLVDAGGDVDAWATTHARALARAARLVTELGAGRGSHLAVAALAVRALRRSG